MTSPCSHPAWTARLAELPMAQLVNEDAAPVQAYAVYTCQVCGQQRSDIEWYPSLALVSPWRFQHA